MPTRILLLAALTIHPMLLTAAEPLCFSGRYPHLTVSNDGPTECGIGAVVPWADRLWLITYSAHRPGGSDDKLYEIDRQLRMVARPESVGGTPAGRMIHRESNQLIIGPYFIDAQRNVRVIPPKKMFGRLTAVARHLTDPANKVYVFDMEGLIYEVDVHSLDVKLLYRRAVPGWHGKGAYTAQGRFVVANNGEEDASASLRGYQPFEYQVPVDSGPEKAGVLAEWDGKTWRVVERRQFNEVSGPGGIYGSPSADAPLWAVGWDKRSELLKLLDHGQWLTYRLPKACHSYDAYHGWHTEWFRIREVVPAADGRPARLLMNAHGAWYDFPAGFSAAQSGGLRPLGAYLKITGDFGHCDGRIVFACDDVARSAFTHGSLDTLNRLNGRSHSNLWFTTWDGLEQAGAPVGFGGPWIEDNVAAQTPSAPYLFAGYAQRTLHLAHRSKQPVSFNVEIDAAGDGRWTAYRTLTVPAEGYVFHVFPTGTAGQWIRLTPDRDAVKATAFFHYGPGGGVKEDRKLFAALADVDQPGPWCGGVMRPEGGTEIPLGLMTQPVDAAGKAGEAAFYQVDAEMRFQGVAADSTSAKVLKEKAVVTKLPFEVDRASVIIKEDNSRVRLPKAGPGSDAEGPTGWLRGLRELVTERSLVNAAGNFYVLPRPSSGGIKRIKPISTHNKRITDFCSWRGMLVMAGTRAGAAPDGHYVASADGKAGLWLGDLDDLWKLGKPRGVGGPWNQTPVVAGNVSDPYLMNGFDQKRMELSHDADRPVTFQVQVEIAPDVWVLYDKYDVAPGQKLRHDFPAGFHAYWVRIKSLGACQATATFVYE